ncbi:MAG: YfhO family protein [Ruminococcus sp.]|nr:YfhO family protein [Ruminococcus sp.]
MSFFKRQGLDAGQKKREMYKFLFIAAFLGMSLSFIPSMIVNKGIFLYYGDFNSQQVMFYQHAHDAVRAGNMAWDWGTDLGTGFVGSYAFYLLGSPFFWLTTLFPSAAVPYLLPWLLCLKTAVAACSAYAYIRYFSKNVNACAIGALLYAFSGFQTYNVFFNHFHDVTAFFPLLLLAFEKLVNENKKGIFALTVALCATISYFFFVCEAVFLVIYFFIRCTDEDFKIDMKKFGLLIFEAVVGGLISGIILLPAVIDVFNNYRVNERLYGLDLVFYGENVRIPRIIQAFFMLSDMPARINILNADRARWASLAGYLPMFSMCGVIAYMRTKKWKNWATKAIVVFGIMACVPILNSSFVLFNSSYYARWYYMPILIMCMMTAVVLTENKDDLKKGFIPCAVVAAFFIGVGMLPKVEDGKTVYGKVPGYIELYYIQAAVTIVMTVALGVLIYYVSKQKLDYMKVAVGMTTGACIICMTSSVIYGVTQGNDNTDYINRAIHGGDNLDMDKLEKNSEYYVDSNNFYRIDTSESVDNWCMFWGLSSMRCFHSVVNTSIMDFYTTIGQTRDVASRMEPKLYALRSLFSVKYYFKELPEDQRNGKTAVSKPQTLSQLKGFKYVDTQNGFNIYENRYYVPMGFTYDYFTFDADVQKINTDLRPNIFMKALVLNEEQAMKYGGILEHKSFEQKDMSESEYNANCLDRRKSACTSFEYDTHGFTAKANLERENLMFFSVPYDKGWSATVNGKEVDIEKVTYGFMAVLCPEGECEIKFTYKTNGSDLGLLMTGTGTVTFIVYMAYDFKKRKELVPVAAKKTKKAEAGDDPKKNEKAETEAEADPGEEDSSDVSE